MLPVGWEGLVARRHVSAIISGDDALMVFATWIGELVKLQSQGLATDRFSVTLEGKCARSLEVWDKLKQAAGLQEAMMKIFHERSLVLPPLRAHPRAQGTPRPRYFPLPCHLPLSFPKAIKDILQGSSIIQFDGDPGYVWELGELVEERYDWSLQAWKEEWDRVVGQDFLSRKDPTVYRDDHFETFQERHCICR